MLLRLVVVHLGEESGMFSFCVAISESLKCVMLHLCYVPILYCIYIMLHHSKM